MSFRREIPRDLFNESKLLKCMGQLALILHDGMGVRWPLTLEHDEESFAGFLIEREFGHDGLFVANMRLLLDGEEVPVYTAYNSKEPYPLYFIKDGDDGEVFTKDGKLSDEFKDWLDSQTT